MTEQAPEQSHGKLGRKGWPQAYIVFGISMLPPVFLLLVMMATHVGLLNYQLGFVTLTLNLGPKLAMVTLALACLSTLVSLFQSPLRYGPWALAAVVVSGAVLGGYALYDRALKKYPPIYDVATNWNRPVTLSDDLLADRGAKALPASTAPVVPSNESAVWAGKTVASINAATCPQAVTYKGKLLTADQVTNVLSGLHYTVFGTSPWRVEAVYQDNFYGFKSDIIVRIDPDGIDVRSVGRDNPHDLGNDCRRVVEILNRFKTVGS